MNFLTGMKMTFNLKDIQRFKFLIQEAEPYTSSLPIQFSNHWAITKCISCRLLVSNLIKGERTLESLLWTTISLFYVPCPDTFDIVHYCLRGNRKKSCFSFLSSYTQALDLYDCTLKSQIQGGIGIVAGVGRNDKM